MSDNTWTTEDLAYLAAVEADYRADVEAVQRAADKAFDLWVEQARAVVEEAPVEKPVKHATVQWVGGWLLAIGLIWAFFVVTPVVLLVGLLAFHQVWCVYGLIAYVALFGLATLGLWILAGEKGR